MVTLFPLGFAHVKECDVILVAESIFCPFFVSSKQSKSADIFPPQAHQRVQRQTKRSGHNVGIYIYISKSACLPFATLDNVGIRSTFIKVRMPTFCNCLKRWEFLYTYIHKKVKVYPSIYSVS